MADIASWNILIIDDEPDSIGVVKLIFDFHRSPVRAAHSGPEGLAMLRQQRPTFLLLDINMPAMTGWDVLKAIREDPALTDLPVIALTAHAMSGDRERILSAGFDGYIPKPISPPTLISSIEEALNGSSRS